MLPEQYFDNIYLYWIPELISFVAGLSYLYLLIIFLPLIIRIFIQVALSFLYFQLKFDLRPVIEFILFPGSMLRVTFIWYILRLYGYNMKIAFRLPDDGQSGSILDRQYHGFSAYAFQQAKAVKETNFLKLAFIISLASYIMLPLVLLLVIFGGSIMAGMVYFLPYNMVGPIYTYVLLALAIGGLPVPEETLIAFYTFIYMYPHLIWATLLNIIATLIYVPFLGPFFATTVFLVMTALIVIINRGFDEANDEFESTEIMRQIVAVS